MKKIALVLLLCSSFSSSQIIAPNDSVVVIKSDYASKIEKKGYPNIAVSVYAWFFGAKPKKLWLEETFIATGGRKKETATMLFADNELWLRMFPNTAWYSFVKFPNFQKIPLTSGALRFAARLKECMRDSLCTGFIDTFEFDNEKLKAVLQREQRDDAPPLKFKNAIRAFSLITYNARGEIYLDVKIIAADYRNQTVYSYVIINFYKKGITIKMFLEKVEIIPQKK